MAFSLPVLASGVEINSQETGNVTPFSFDIVWEVSGECSPGMEVYSDSEGTSEISSAVRVEYYPLHVGDPEVSSDYAGRISRRALRDGTVDKRLVMARVSGLAPDTACYVRPLALDPDGTDITTNGPVPLVFAKTARENAFVAESRLLVMDFSGQAQDVSGGIARLLVPGLAYPLFAVIGDGMHATEACFNLDNLLDAAGLTNLNPSSPLNLEISLMGLDLPEAVVALDVPYGGGFVTAEATASIFLPVVDSFVFDPIGEQAAGTAFSVTIRALDFKGNPLTAFTDAVDISSNLSLADGGGRTAAFTDGVLSHSVTFAEGGEAQLTATGVGIDATGTSNSFNVSAIMRELLLLANPANGGTLSGAGSYADGTLAAIEASPSPNFLFGEWIGEGVTDPAAASTTVSMTADRSLTASFVDDPEAIDYAEWKVAFFKELAGDPVITAAAYDYDVDGYSNLFEYATGTDPTQPDPNVLIPHITIDPAGGELTLFYEYNSRAVDLSLTIQLSSGMDTDWTPHTPDPSDITETFIGDGLYLVSVRIPVSLDSPRFLRLVFTLSQ